MNKFLLGDCLELLPSIPDKSVDMILCDLPYGTTYCEWDSVIDMVKLWEQYERVIKDNGAIVLTTNARFTFTLYNSNPKLFRYKWIWYKGGTTGFLNANKMPFTTHEDILVFYSKMPIYNPQKTKGDPYLLTQGSKSKIYDAEHCKDKVQTINTTGDRYPQDVIFFSKDKGFHPTQKPVSLFEYLIKTYTNENDVVLDNCAGSGTTAIACINTNRRYICMEQNKEYYDKAITRLRNHEPLLQLIGIDK
jgi:site-specific DNA-methyltransferase (adenine-specific)